MRMLHAPNVPNPVCLTAGSDFAFADLIAPALADARPGMTVASPVPVGAPRGHFSLTTPPSTAYRTRFDTGADALVDRFRDRRPEVVVAAHVEAAPASRDTPREAEVNAGSAEHLAEPSRLDHLCHETSRRTRPRLLN